jgi:hypothetical protein
MRIARLIVVSVAVSVAAALPTLVSASDGAKAPKDRTVSKASTSSVSSSQFATLKSIKAVPMSARDLEAVKGLHVHFIDPHNGFTKVHLAGDVKTENNWSNEWGGTDGAAVAPSYRGLCVSHSRGGIFIPTMGPITLECP